MKKSLSFLTASLLLMSAPSHAVLPPLYQTSKEIKSILASPELDKKLHAGEVIMQITKNETGYEITTNQHRIQVDIIYQHTGKIGPAEYTIEFHNPLPSN